jgi:hypothetical protein
MSLDIYLRASSPPTSPNSGSGMFIRRNGETVEISREEWDRHFPEQEPVILTAEYEVDTTVFHRNITHNLISMAKAARLYEAFWRPEEINATRAKQLIEPLTTGLQILRAEPDKFKEFNPPNGWGTYEGLLAFVESYLDACKKFPEATIYVSR